MALTIKRNDTKPWVVTLKENGEAVDLTDAASVALYMDDADGTAVIDGGSCTISATPTTGVVTYSPTAEDVDTSGSYDAEFEVTWADGTISTFPNDSYEVVTIVDDLG